MFYIEHIIILKLYLILAKFFTNYAPLPGIEPRSRT